MKVMPPVLKRENRSVRLNSVLEDLEAPFEMANLRPKSTGLPMTIWVSERGRAKHGPRIKVSLKRGDKIDIEDTTTVTIEETPQIVGKTYQTDWHRSVSKFISMNHELLLEYWNGEIDTAELLERLKRVE